MLAVIVNPAAGGGRAGRALARVTDALAGLGLAHRVEATSGLDHARALARTAAAAGETAVAFGGDGLVGAVAGALAGADGLLGVLPGGRGKDFARWLGIPRDPVAACDALARGRVERLDLGRAGEGTFVGIASCGFDSVANSIANDSRLVHGSLVYACAALRALVSWRPVSFTIALDGGAARTFTGYTVAAANAGAYGGGMRLAPDASLADGLLDVVLIRRIPRLQFLALMPTVFTGAHVRRSCVEVHRARELRIEADRPFTLFADGDPIARLPVTVSVAPRAVRVLVP
jgi:YegS/Rv2252/BmrU family lipid kinase